MECNKHPVLISNVFKLKPAVVAVYNKTMGGEDILSRLIRDYSPIADSMSMQKKETMQQLKFNTVLSRDNTSADDTNDSETTLLRKRKKNSTDDVPKIVAEHSSLFLTPTKMTPRKISQEFSVPKRYKNDTAVIQFERDRRENCMGVPMFSCAEKEPKHNTRYNHVLFAMSSTIPYTRCSCTTSFTS
eukprot:Pgem_evm2s19775